MATSLFALLDDIASVLDDIASLTQLAAKKTTGVLGDDLALNAQQVAGVHAERELPVVWAVFKGSLRNKLILVPVALALSALAPQAVLPLLMAGGVYLCFEGFEKLAERFLHPKPAGTDAQARQPLTDPAVDLVVLERQKIKGAIRTDFILSAEIIVITLGTVSSSGFVTQLAVLGSVALLMTVGVYGLVAGIVKLDDAGLALSQMSGQRLLQRARRAFGRGILRAAPQLMKTLSVVGTAAMFLVGGGILRHGIAPLHHLLQEAFATLSPPLLWLLPLLADALTGVLAGALALAVVVPVQRLWRR